MGLLKKLKELVVGKEPDDEWNIEGDKEADEMNGYYDDDNGPTILYSDNPQIQEIRTQDGGYARGNPGMINDINMRETQRINNSVLIPGQVVDRGRGRQRPVQQGPRRIAPQQEMAPQQAPRMTQPQQAEAQQRYQQQQWQRQQWEEQQRQQEFERQQQEQEFYSQQQMYYQQQGKDSLPDSIQRVPVPYGEPYSEMAVANGKYHFWLDLPGVNPEDISVSYVNMELWISGKRQLKSLAMMPKTRSRGNKGKRPEFDAQITIPQFVENFDYRFPFPRPVDQDSIESDLSQGILHVEMTILDAGAPAGVQIKVGKK